MHYVPIPKALKVSQIMNSCVRFCTQSPKISKYWILDPLSYRSDSGFSWCAIIFISVPNCKLSEPYFINTAQTTRSPCALLFNLFAFSSTTYTKQKSMFSTSCYYIYDLWYWWIIVVIIVKSDAFYNCLIIFQGALQHSRGGKTQREIWNLCEGIDFSRCRSFFENKYAFCV